MVEVEGVVFFLGFGRVCGGCGGLGLVLGGFCGVGVSELFIIVIIVLLFILFSMLSLLLVFHRKYRERPIFLLPPLPRFHLHFHLNLPMSIARHRQ